jgi:hypothetical protein
MSAVAAEAKANAEGKSLEAVTKPLTATDEPPAKQPVAAPA